MYRKDNMQRYLVDSLGNRYMHKHEKTDVKELECEATREELLHAIQDIHTISWQLKNLENSDYEHWMKAIHTITDKVLRHTK